MSPGPSGRPAWKIWYADRSCFSSAEGTPQSAPPFGVVCIVFPDEVVGRVIMHGWDWYYWVAEHKQWWGSDIHGVLDRLLHNLPLVALKQGRNVHNKDFGELLHKADEDPDFPTKSGRRKGEHP